MSSVLSITMNITIASDLVEKWELVPLGPKVSLPTFSPAPKKRSIVSNFKREVIDASPVTLVRDGVSQAVIIYPKSSPGSITRGVEDLRSSLKKMTGADVKVFPEHRVAFVNQDGKWKVRAGDEMFSSAILIGKLDFLEKLDGYSIGDLPAEGYRIRAGDGFLILAGQDKNVEGKNYSGTSHAIMNFLERHLGFRWLWPGELGEVVPQGKNIVLEPFQESDAPLITQRKMRNYGVSSALYSEPGQQEGSFSPGERTQMGLKQLGLTDAQFQEYFKDSPGWFAHQCLGGSLNLRYTHAYEGYWDRYGKEHPEWFALQPNGSRIQVPPREQLNVANPQLIEQVAENKIKELAENPDLDSVSVSPNDNGKNSFDMGEECRKLDPPNGLPIEFTFFENGRRKSARYPSLTDRYLTFYNGIAEKVAEKFPDKLVAGYAYSAYRYPPLYAKAHPNLLLGFVGLDYFDERRREDDLQSWDMWAQNAKSFFLRPNIFHSGHALPANYTLKMAEDIRHTYETGMIAADFDAVLHNWATQGLNYYVLARILWDPSRRVEDIVTDYCEKGFGSAAPAIEKYFKQLEDLTNKIATESMQQARQGIRDDEDDVTPAGFLRNKFLDAIPRYYNAGVLSELQATLDRAKELAGNDATVKQRIEFLEQGLRYAAIQAKLRNPENQKNVAHMTELLQERWDLYREVFKKYPFALNVSHLSWREGGELEKKFHWAPPSEVQSKN